MNDFGAARAPHEASWPCGWGPRVDGWAQGLAYRMDWPARQVGTGLASPAQAAPLLEDRGALAQPALIGANRSGRLMAFSARAVNQARDAWEYFQIRWVYHSAWHLSWLNGVTAEGALGFRADWGIAGLDVIDFGAFYVLFCPEVLGPLGALSRREDLFGDRGGGLRTSPNLDVQVTSSGVAIRGGAVFDGWWRPGAVEPFAGEGGWLRLPI